MYAVRSQAHSWSRKGGRREGGEGARVAIASANITLATDTKDRQAAAAAAAAAANQCYP